MIYRLSADFGSQAQFQIILEEMNTLAQTYQHYSIAFSEGTPSPEEQEEGHNFIIQGNIARIDQNGTIRSVTDAMGENLIGEIFTKASQNIRELKKTVDGILHKNGVPAPYTPVSYEFEPQFIPAT